MTEIDHQTMAGFFVMDGRQAADICQACSVLTIEAHPDVHVATTAQSFPISGG